MTKLNNARPQVQPATAHADQRDRAARLRDTSGRFTKSRDAAPTSSATFSLPAPTGTIPAPAGAPDDAYALSVNDASLGLHAAPGSAIVVAPTMPTGAGLAVFYLKGRSGSVVYDLTHGFRPERAIAFAPSSELMPLIEVVVPGTGETGGLRAEIVEKIHRVVGVYTPVEVADNAPSLPSKLPVLSECPEGMGEQYAYDAAAYPLVRKGETVVYDPSRREPTHGALYVMQWDNGSARNVMLTNLRKVGGQGEPRWWVDPVNRIGVGTRYASDGPYDADHLRGKIVGAVVGVLVPRRIAEPTREPEAKTTSETAPPDTVDEIYAAAEREREAAERAALNDADLTSGVSAEVRAAIMRHGEVMRETELQGDETDEEFAREADMQNEAEHAVAHTPAQNLADLRAKLTYLLPIMAPDMLDRWHVGYLTAIRDDADRLCREGAPPAKGGQEVADPVLAAIQAHVAARNAFVATCNPNDRVWRREQGLSTSDEAMALAEAAWQASSRLETEAWNAVFETRPTTLPGLVAVIQHAQRWVPENDGTTGSMALGSILGAIAADAQRLALAPLPDAPEETDGEAQVRLAATPFIPNDKDGPCPLPSKKEWIEAANGSLRWLRLGFMMLCASREELTAVIRDQSDDEYRDLMSGLGVAARNLAGMARLAHDAQNRIIIGTAILAEEERLSGKGEEA